MRSRAFLASALVALLPLLPRLAFAQSTAPSLDLRGFHAPTDAASGLYLEPADSPGTGEWNAGLWFSYAYRPITLRDPSTNAVAFDVIRHQVTSDFTANIGIAHRVALGIDVPVLIYQTGDDPTPSSTRTMGAGSLPRHALGDVGLNAKFTLVRPTGGDLGGFSLALHERLTLPTGDEASYMGEGAVTGETRLLAEYRLVALSLHLAAGFKFRAEQDDFACGAVSAIDACKSRFGNEIPFGAGIAFRPQVLGIDAKGRWTWYLETHGYLPAGPIAPFASAAASSAQLGLGARFALRDVSFLAGVETALTGGIGDAPVRGLLSVAWAPRSHDKDGDGIDDEVDQCPDLPEDYDGFMDSDGCPDLDNDDDGIPDSADKCPNEKEDEDGFQDTDGCPDPDNDGDGILDKQDACPNEAGPANADPKKNGCPTKDRDGDGILDDQDACPDAAGPANADPKKSGCPTKDRDGDGILDAEDKCPDVKGIDSANPAEKGCPDPDPDKDTFIGLDDKCPDQAETWNGIEDDDGCPEDATKKGKVVVAVKEGKTGTTLEVGPAVSFTASNEVDAPSLLTLRAIASELVRHPTWSIKVGVRVAPKDKEGEKVAEARAAAIVRALKRFARRETAAETAAWGDVKGAPRAAVLGVGFVVVAPEGAQGGAAPKKR